MLTAKQRGMFRVDKDLLAAINSIGDITFTTIADHYPVEEGDRLASVRIVPLVTKEEHGSSELSGSRARTKTVTAGAGQYIWFAYPARLGAATFKVGGFEGGFTLVDGSFSHTNASGYTEAYRVYRSDNAGLGATTVVVS